MSNTSDHMYKFQKYNTEQKPPGQNNTYKQYFFKKLKKQAKLMYCVRR